MTDKERQEKVQKSSKKRQEKVQKTSKKRHKKTISPSKTHLPGARAEAVGDQEMLRQAYWPGAPGAGEVEVFWSWDDREGFFF